MTTNGGRRLDCLMPRLTPRERAVMVLRRWKAGQEPEPQLLRSSRPGEAAEYNRLIDVLQTASGELSQYGALLHLAVSELGTRFAWFFTAVLWGNGRSEDEDRRAGEICELLADQLRTGVSLRAQELEALDVVLREVAERFDGEDPIKPAARELIEATRDHLETLIEDVDRYLGGLDRGEPSEEQIAFLRRLIEQER